MDLLIYLYSQTNPEIREFYSETFHNDSENFGYMRVELFKKLRPEYYLGDLIMDMVSCSVNILCFEQV